MKAKPKKIITLDPRLAWDRCRICEHIGIGINAGKCKARRGSKGKYMPIEQVFCCPIGRKIGDKAEETA